MARCTSRTLLFSILAAGLLSGNADARSRLPADSNTPALIAEASPTLAPFQHVRFCLHYPSECKSDPTENERIELTAENSELLNRVNRSVNAAIIPTLKRYGTDLQGGWTIAPAITPSPSAMSCIRAGCQRKRYGCRWSRRLQELAMSFS